MGASSGLSFLHNPRAGWRLAALVAVCTYLVIGPFTQGFKADFAKQWLAARMVATGQCPDLYNREANRAELIREYDPGLIENRILSKNLPPTYPPTLAVLYAPLGFLSPPTGQAVVAAASVILALVAAYAIQQITEGRILAPAAATAILFLPSFFASVALGQNAALSLALFAGGWAFLVRRRPLLAGAVWGLFAFKPTWALAVSWLPAAVRQPRAYLGMAASAAAFIGITLPFCGVGPWLDWLKVARLTEQYYQTYEKWTLLSRDVPGLFRRAGTGTLAEGAGLVAVVLIAALSVWAWRTARTNGRDAGARKRTTALLAGAALSCPRFMYYDITLGVVAFFVGLAGWKEESLLSRIALATLAGVFWGGTALSYIISQQLGPPIETLALVGLWVWGLVECWRLRTVNPHPSAVSSTALVDTGSPTR